MIGRTLKGCVERRANVDILAPFQGAELLPATHPWAARIALAPGYLLLPLRGSTVQRRG